MTMTGSGLHCRGCGASLNAGTSFCVSCGTAVSAPQPVVGVPSLPVRAPVSADIALIEGETERFRTVFAPHVLLKHLTVTIVLTERRLIVRRPHTIFGVVPHGFVEHSSPVSSLVEVTAADVWSTRRLLAAAGCGLWALGMLFDFFGGVGLLAAILLVGGAVYLAASARTMGLIVRNSGAGRLVAPAGRRELGLVTEAAAKVNAASNPPR